MARSWESGVRTAAAAVTRVRQPGIQGGLKPMKRLWIKKWFMGSVCAGLATLAFGDVQAFADHLTSTPAATAQQPSAPAQQSGSSGQAGSGWVTRKIQVTELVPTWVEETVTVMQPQQREETYTAYRVECVPETVTRQVVRYQKVTETVTEMRTVVERVPVQKQVTVMERVPVEKEVTVMERRPVQKQVTVNEVQYKRVLVTEMRPKTVTHKVSVPVTVELGPTLADRLRKICDPCYEPCPRTVTVCKTEKHKETICEPVTVCKKIAECVPVTKTICTYECVPVTKKVCVYEYRPVTKTVCAYECVTKQVACPVTKVKCVPVTEQVTCVVHVKKFVPYEAKRYVTVCVPVQQKVKVCKMVPQVVEKEVKVPAPAQAAPCPPSAACAQPCERAGLLDRLRALLAKKRCGEPCPPSCEAAPAQPAPCPPAACDPCATPRRRLFDGFNLCRKAKDDCCNAPVVAGAAAGCSK